MNQTPKPRTQKLTIIAQDPGVTVKYGSGTSILRAVVDVPAENLEPGPWGYRVQVIDYDASSDMLWKPVSYSYEKDVVIDPFLKKSDAQLLRDPKFHQQNVYAVVMRILFRFEFALGRRVSWSFGGHQLKVAPHAFADANAFYSKDDECLLFGYFADPSCVAKKIRPKAERGIIFTCLSHDVIAHETTHAIVDGLRRRFTEPSSPDQAAFHEGISDVVALLSVFALREVMAALLKDQDSFTVESLRKTALFKLAEQMGSLVSQVRGSTLRHSVEMRPNKKWISDPEFQPPHRRGEILVAAVLNALIHIWAERVAGLRQSADGLIDLNRVVEEGHRAADYLLTMAIRALDYCPPVHLEFGDYLSAMLTADREIRPDDSIYMFRAHLRKSFEAYGIKPASTSNPEEVGIWQSAEPGTKSAFNFDRTHFEPMQRDRDEVFRFVWENREELGLREDAYTEVQSVRPCTRVGTDGFILRETVAEYVQILRLTCQDLSRAKVPLPPPEQLPRDQEIFLHGGGTLIFDEYGRLKYHVHNHLNKNGKISPKQIERLHFLANAGYFLQRGARPATARAAPNQFSQMHLNRGLNRRVRADEGWYEELPPSTLTHAARAHGLRSGADEDDNG